MKPRHVKFEKNANKNIKNLIYNKMIYKKANMAYMTQRQSLNYRLRTWEEKKNVARLNMCVGTLPSPSLAQWYKKKSTVPIFRRSLNRRSNQYLFLLISSIRTIRIEVTKLKTCCHEVLAVYHLNDSAF